MSIVLRASDTEYSPTAEDILWLMRAVEAEGEPRAQVAETLVNGFMWARSELGYTRSLADWVRSYAQPVNPRWFLSGDLYRASLSKNVRNAEAQQARAHAREHVHSTRTMFTVKTRQAVESALNHGPTLTGATDYAAPTVRRRDPWVPLTPPIPGQNRFWTRPGAIGWRGYRVDRGTATVVVALAWLAVGYVVWRVL